MEVTGVYHIQLALYLYGKGVALIAVANKLLKIGFAISKSGLPYDPLYKSYKPV